MSGPTFEEGQMYQVESQIPGVETKPRIWFARYMGVNGKGDDTLWDFRPAGETALYRFAWLLNWVKIPNQVKPKLPQIKRTGDGK